MPAIEPWAGFRVRWPLTDDGCKEIDLEPFLRDTA